jgi:hypothetical protein
MMIVQGRLSYTKPRSHRDAQPIPLHRGLEQTNGGKRAETNLVERNQFRWNHPEHKHALEKKEDEVGEEEKEKRQRSEEWELGLGFGSSPSVPLRFSTVSRSCRCIVFASNYRLHHRSWPFQSHIVKRRVVAVHFIGPLAAALLLLVGLRGEVDSAAHRWVRARLTRVQSLAGNDAVDFWEKNSS